MRRARLHPIPFPTESAARVETRAPSPRSLYPPEYGVTDGYPTEADVAIEFNGDHGLGIYARRPFLRGHLICRISGVIVHEVRQHTLQISTTAHLYDPYFTGYLLHSCGPNTFLDMQRFELWALTDIDIHQALTMDYASTEDTLFRQFPCSCGSANCRTWITGRREPVQAVR